MSVHDDLATALDGNPEATGTLLACFDSMARHSEWVSNAVAAGQQREIDEWRTRALIAEARLERAQDRLDYIIGG